jgi:hypothetical protein
MRKVIVTKSDVQRKLSKQKRYTKEQLLFAFSKGLEIGKLVGEHGITEKEIKEHFNKLKL